MHGGLQSPTPPGPHKHHWAQPQESPAWKLPPQPRSSMQALLALDLRLVARVDCGEWGGRARPPELSLGGNSKPHEVKNSQKQTFVICCPKRLSQKGSKILCDKCTLSLKHQITPNKHRVNQVHITTVWKVAHRIHHCRKEGSLPESDSYHTFQTPKCTTCDKNCLKLRQYAKYSFNTQLLDLLSNSKRL